MLAARAETPVLLMPAEVMGERMIAVIVGPDGSMARDAVRDILRDRDPSGQSTSTIDGKTATLNDIRMDATSVGFFSAGRVVIVEDVIARLGKTGARDGASPPDWAGLFTAIPDASTLILLDPSLAAVPAPVRKALPKDARIVISDPPRGRELLDWIRAQASSEGSSIDQPTARLLADTLYPTSWSTKSTNPAFDRPPDLEALRNEVAKLAVAAHPGPITRSHINNLIAQGDTDQIFAFIDAATRGRIGEATVQLDRLLSAGEDPNKVLAQLSQTIELSVVMEAAGHRPAGDVGKDLRLPNANRMSSIERGLRGQRPGQSRIAGRALESADRRMKTGELRDAVDVLYDTLAVIAASRGQGR